MTTQAPLITLNRPGNGGGGPPRDVQWTHRSLGTSRAAGRLAVGDWSMFNVGTGDSFVILFVCPVVSALSGVRRWPARLTALAKLGLLTQGVLDQLEEERALDDLNLPRPAGRLAAREPATTSGSRRVERSMLACRPLGSRSWGVLRWI